MYCSLCRIQKHLSCDNQCVFLYINSIVSCCRSTVAAAQSWWKQQSYYRILSDRNVRAWSNVEGESWAPRTMCNSYRITNQISWAFSEISQLSCKNNIVSMINFVIDSLESLFLRYLWFFESKVNFQVNRNCVIYKSNQNRN